MLTDPQFPFMVGRLVGACESASILLRNSKLNAEDLKDVGEKLDEVASWFLDQKHIPKSEQDTQVGGWPAGE